MYSGFIILMIVTQITREEFLNLFKIVFSSQFLIILLHCDSSRAVRFSTFPSFSVFKFSFMAFLEYRILFDPSIGFVWLNSSSKD
jgi:hypothetical protein